MRDTAKSAYQTIRAAHWALVELTERTRVETKSSTHVADLVDTIYALKETSKLLDDGRKEVNRLIEELEKQVCQLWVRIGTGDPIRGEYCTGSPNLKQTPKTPKAGTEEYAAFCRSFGVEPDSFFRPHWPSMLEQLAERTANGLPLPPGCDPSEVLTIFRVTVRKRRPVLDEAEAPPVQDPGRLRTLVGLITALVTADPGDTDSCRALVAARDAYLEMEYQDNLDEPEEVVKAPVADEETPF